MLHEALFDAPHINKFCFASESCIPIRSLSDTLDILYSANVDGNSNIDDGSNSSWLNYSDIPNNGYAKQLQVCHYLYSTLMKLFLSTDMLFLLLL